MSSPPADTSRHDVLVIGGGPSGASTAYWLAKAGHDVAVVERKTFPREKTCGDGLTPRAVKQLHDMGLRRAARRRSTATTGCGPSPTASTLELPWPEHPVFPSYGYVVRRRELDPMVAEHAATPGPRCWQGTEAVAPIVRDGLVRGAVVQDKADGPTPSSSRARYVVVADGANSRFGRALGTSRNRAYPQGMAIRGYCASRHARRRRGSRARSTSATATARRSPATAGSSRWATAPSTWASVCSRRSATSRASTPPTS